MEDERHRVLPTVNGYVGSDAANDDDWADRVYDVLQENWPNPKIPYIDMF